MISPQQWRNAIPLPESRCRMNPSPPNARSEFLREREIEVDALL